MAKNQRIKLLRILICAAAMLALQWIPLSHLPKTVLSLAAYFLIGYDILRKAFRGICNRRVFDENFLMALATVGAIVLAFLQHSYDFTEAIAVMLFYQIGELFEHYAVDKSRRSIGSLMDIRPDYANIEENGKLVQIDPEEVSVGSIIVVQPGEKVPIDGIVISGVSALNTSALTGESLPQDVSAGSEVISGCINMTGLLRIRTTKNFSDSTISKILELVEESGTRKAKSEKFIARFARVYTPAVCLSALVLALLPPVVQILLGEAGLWNIWFYRALTFLVISCPCALVISIPLSFFSGIGGASRYGILIKGANYLEALSQAKTVVLDKTGTLTEGTFQVTGIYPNTIPAEKLLEYAALAECASSHPISKSLVAAYGKVIDRTRVSNIAEHSGAGINATVDGHRIAVGSEKLMKIEKAFCEECSYNGTVIHVAIDGAYAGKILVADAEKTNAKVAISKLRSAGIRQVVMLTGDNPTVADAVAQSLGIDIVYSRLLPNGKVEKVESLMEQAAGKLVFVGDGINDAPVLSRADIGIAMGAIGSDAAIEAADVVLMDDNLEKIPLAIQIAKTCMRIVYQNIFFAIGIKLVCLLLGAFGIANMWFAIFADVGVMVLAVLNAVRAFRVKQC